MYPEMTRHATLGHIHLQAHVFSGHACSSCAYRSTNFFVPRPGKLTERRRSSSSPSTPTIVPTPKFGWRTFRPRRGFASAPRLAAGRVNALDPADRRGADGGTD